MKHHLGQLLILGVRDLRWTSRLERQLRAIQPGGVLLFPESLRSPGQTAALLRRISGELQSPAFLAITEEGGSVNPLKTLLPPLPPPRAVARRGPSAGKQAGELIGAALKLLGFNLNFAPALDLASPGPELPRDAQTFGDDPRFVSRCGAAFIEGLQKHRIFACGKHFPGRGTPEQNREGLPAAGKTMAELWREDLIPFRQLLPRLPLIQLTNVSYKAYDFDVFVPAAMSPKIVHDLLRVKLAYRGLAVADIFELFEEKSAREKGLVVSLQTLVQSLRAGCDLQVMSIGQALAGKLLMEIWKVIESESGTQCLIENSITRIRAVKRALKRPSGKLSARRFDLLARRFEEFGQLVKSGGEIEA